MQNLCNYLTKAKDDREVIVAGGYGVNPDNPRYVIDQMKLVKEYFGKTGDNPVMHIMIAYDDSVKNPQLAHEYSKRLAEYYASDYQVYYATHKNDSGYDTHLVINSLNYNTGNLFRSSFGNMKPFCEFVYGITGQFTTLDFKK